MAKKKKIVYHLYALPMSEKAVETAQKERFSRICAGYALIYTQGAVEGGVEIGESESKLLSKVEAEWLQDCNIVIIAEEAKRNEKKILSSLSNRMTVLEQALAEAKRKENVEHGAP